MSWAGPALPPLATPHFFPDLRWNHIGLLGGRALVNCLPSNRTLWKLELAGNNIPGDILRAVGMGTWGCWQIALFEAGHRADSLLTDQLTHLLKATFWPLTFGAEPTEGGTAWTGTIKASQW